MSQELESSYVDSYTYNKNEGDVFVEEDFTLVMNNPSIDGKISIDGEFHIL